LFEVISRHPERSYLLPPPGGAQGTRVQLLLDWRRGSTEAPVPSLGLRCALGSSRSCRRAFWSRLCHSLPGSINDRRALIICISTSEMDKYSPWLRMCLFRPLSGTLPLHLRLVLILHFVFICLKIFQNASIFLRQLSESQTAKEGSAYRHG